MFSNCSCGGSFKSLVVLVAVLSLCSPKSWSDSITFTESEKDSLKCTNKVSCDTFTTGKFTMKGLFFTERDLVPFEGLLVPGTKLDVSVGHWSGSVLFGDDPKYKNGGKKATIKLIDTNGCNAKTVTHGTIKFSGSSKGITITVSTKTGDTACDAFEDPAIVGNFAGDSGSVTGVVSVAIDIGNGTLATNMDVTVIGSASVKTVIKNGETNNLNSVTVRGKE